MIIIFILFLKTLGGWNCDRMPLSSTPKSFGSELHLEASYRDFTCNALCYDPLNKMIIDPTGFGMQVIKYRFVDYEIRFAL